MGRLLLLCSKSLYSATTVFISQLKNKVGVSHAYQFHVIYQTGQHVEATLCD